MARATVAMARGADSGGLQAGQGWKPLPQVAAVDGGEPVGLDLSMSGDEEVGDEVLARAPAWR